MFPTFPLQGALYDPYIEDVTLLLHGNGANNGTVITDNSPYNHSFTRFGNVCTKTDQYKFGGSSLFFDGSGDYLVSPDTTAWNFLAADFTIELWFRARSFDPGTALKYPNLFGQRDDFGANESFYCFVTNNGTMGIAFTYNAGGAPKGRTWNYTFATDTWYHLAFSRNGADLRCFINGIMQSGVYNMGTDSIRDSSQDFYIGALPGAISETYWNGWIEEFRITRGIGRYTADFALPTQPYPNPV